MPTPVIVDAARTAYGRRGKALADIHAMEGVPFEVEFRDDLAHASVVANALHEGLANSLHGGIGAWLLTDCMLGMLCRRAADGRSQLDWRSTTSRGRRWTSHGTRLCR